MHAIRFQLGVGLCALSLALLPAKARATWPRDPSVSIPVAVAAGDQKAVVAVSDGSGGAILAWQDSRTGPVDILAQRIDANGTPLWTANGVVVCNAVGDQTTPTIISDNA